MLKSKPRNCGPHCDNAGGEEAIRGKDCYISKYRSVKGPEERVGPEPRHLPPLAFPDLSADFACGARAGEQFRCYKSLEAHVQFAVGWVHDL